MPFNKELPLLHFSEISNYMRIAKRNLLSLSILAFFYFRFDLTINKISISGLEFKKINLPDLNNYIEYFIIIFLTGLLIQYIFISINYIKAQLNKLPTGGNRKLGFFSKIQARVFQKNENLESSIKSLLTKSEDEKQKIFNIKAYVEAHTKEILIPFYKLFYREQIGLRVIFDILLPISIAFVSITLSPKIIDICCIQIPFWVIPILFFVYGIYSIFQIQIRNKFMKEENSE